LAEKTIKMAYLDNVQLELAEIKSTSDISMIQEPITFSRQELKKFKRY
jgi:hypothetical protein